MDACQTGGAIARGLGFSNSLETHPVVKDDVPLQFRLYAYLDHCLHFWMRAPQDPACLEPAIHAHFERTVAESPEKDGMSALQAEARELWPFE